MDGMRFVMSLQTVDPVGDNGAGRAFLVAPCDCQLVGFVLSAWTVSALGSTSLQVNEEGLLPEIMLPAGNYVTRVVDFDEFTGTGGQPLRLQKGDTLQMILYVGENSQGVRADAVFLEG